MHWLTKLGRSKLAWIALGLGAVTLLALNMLADQTLKLYRADLTASKLFTISEPTREVLSGLDEPINIRLYFSSSVGARAPNLAQLADRASNLLRYYSDLSGGKVVFERIDPEPFSDNEDRAVAAGLQAVPLGQGQETGYFGLVGTNSTDDQEVIAFLTPERQNFLEYDLTRMVHKLADPKRKVIGLVSSLQIAGGATPQGQPRPAWLIHQQLTEFFDVRPLNSAVPSIPGDVDVLLIVAPGKLSEPMVFAIDQFALSGKPVIAMVDPFSEVSLRPQAVQMTTDDPLHKLFKAWGAKVEPGKFVGDIEFARQVQFGTSAQPKVASYVAWLTLDSRAFDPKDVLFSSINRLVMASPGRILPVKGAGPKFQPLIRSSAKAMLIDVAKMSHPDPLKLLQAYKPGNERMVLAARLSGNAVSAFPDGAPKLKGAEGSQDSQLARPAKASGKINVVLVADGDMLFDSFWAQARQLLGQRVIIPQANNADFVLNALENMTGGAALSGLRGRGVEQRPFVLVQRIRQVAETRFRQREQVLNNKLVQTQKKLREIQTRSGGGKVILSDDDKTAIRNFRQEIISIRKDLREVQRALRADIENLGFWVKFANIAGLPLIIGLIGVVIGLARRARSRP